MARPSVREERTEAILDAFERCIARFGVEGASLQRIADEAGLARALLRHHVGNREELIAVLARRFADRTAAETADFLAELPAEGRLQAMIDILFDARYASPDSEVIVAEALIAAARTRPELRGILLRWYDDFEAALAGELRAAYPAAAEDAVRTVATGLTGIYFNVDSLTSLEPPEALRVRARAAAIRLIGTLGGA